LSTRYQSVSLIRAWNGPEPSTFESSNQPKVVGTDQQGHSSFKYKTLQMANS